MGRPPKDAHRTSTRVRLLDAAESAFGEHGFSRARLADVAERAGISRPSLLHHFGSKRRLYAAVVVRAFSELTEAVETAAGSSARDLVSLLDAVTGRLLEFADERPGVPALVLRELIDWSGDHVGDTLESEVVPLIDRLEALVRSAGEDSVPSEFPVRDAILALLVSHLVKAAAPAGAPRLWPSDDATPVLIRALMLGAATARTPESADTATRDGGHATADVEANEDHGEGR